MTWDQSGRQIDHYLNIGGQRTHISKQAYTVKDQLKEKNLGNSTFTSLQSLDYTYLANGFLRGINHVQTEVDDWFKLGIHYDQPDGTTISGFTPQYNGNIGALSWQTGTGNEQVYRYAYDYLDRITSAQMTGNTYRTAYYYDQKGNLLTLDRYDANGTMIDDLSYIPYSGTNKIKNLFDGGTSAGFDEGDAPIFAAYTYDANGNLAHDPFKNLDIAYNHLNLPDTIIQPGSTNRIVWHYDVAGNKLRKEVLNDSIVLTGPFTENQYQARFITTDGQPTALDSTLLVAQDSIVFKPGFHAKSGLRLTAKIDSTLVPTDQTDYIGGVEYRNGGIRAIYHPEGRAVPSGSNWRHEYVITDHLGNTRLRFSDLDGNSQIDSTELLSMHDYYPYGMEWNAGGYKYTYNGKEKNTEIGLNWLDYHNRWLDPVIGRWNSVDPRVEKYIGWSPYNYVLGNPIRNIDPQGDTVRVAVGNEFINYTPGMEYTGDNKFAQGVINSLNTMNTSEAGAEVLGSLVASEDSYSFVNVVSTDKKGNPVEGVRFRRGENGGGTIEAGASNDVSTIAHELFHGYQIESGMNPATTAGEVGAYLFQDVVTLQAGVSSSSSVSTNEYGMKYDEAHINLLYDGFNESDYISANKFFKYSSKNATGLYNRTKQTISPFPKPPIARFLPAFK